jgi:hypothetical protein
MPRRRSPREMIRRVRPDCHGDVQLPVEPHRRLVVGQDRRRGHATLGADRGRRRAARRADHRSRSAGAGGAHRVPHGAGRDRHRDPALRDRPRVGPRRPAGLRRAVHARRPGWRRHPVPPGLRAGPVVGIHAAGVRVRRSGPHRHQCRDHRTYAVRPRSAPGPGGTGDPRRRRRRRRARPRYALHRGRPGPHRERVAARRRRPADQGARVPGGRHRARCASGADLHPLGRSHAGSRQRLIVYAVLFCTVLATLAEVGGLAPLVGALAAGLVCWRRPSAGFTSRSGSSP